MIKFASALALGLALCSAAAAAPTQTTPKPAAATRDVLPTDVRPERYEIRIAPNAQNLTFTGQARIEIMVTRPTRRIELNAADIAFHRVAVSGVAGDPKIAQDETRQVVALTFERVIAPGRHTLSIDYSGRIYQQASGLFALDYDTPTGKRRALFTQFENSDARRFVPSWDEPGIKSVFSISVEAPADEMVISNMPVAKETPLTGGRKLVTFSDTPRMSSYLMFLALGDFERIHRQVGNTDVGVVVRRGETAKAAFDLDAASKLLAYYNDYFQKPFPLPKLDMIAAPGQSQFFCAMENWGAILYFERCFLVDPKLSTESDRQRAFLVIAHEIAHQWFGNLVTMAWWDDLWLNEGFASWIEQKATDHFHPEWKIWLQATASQQQAMRLDAQAGTHPIITPIPDVFAASSAFDAITYEKGSAIIRMLETYVGSDAFRTGVRNYIAHNAYGNTVTDDLWRELDKVSPRPVTQIAHDFTLQAGVPLISVEQRAGGLRLTQGRFGADESQRAPRAWTTPVLVGSAGEPATWRGIVRAGAPATAPVSGAIPIVNAGQTGYFRTAYPDALKPKLAAAFMTLSPEDQLGLLYDSQALGESGHSQLSSFAELTQHVTPDADPIVLSTLTNQLAALDDDYADLPRQAGYRAFARARLAPILAKIGWDRRPGEADNIGLLRPKVLTILGAMDDAGVVAEARRRYAAWVANPESLSGDQRRTVLSIMAAHADAAAWDQFHARARAETDPAEKTRLYQYLGRSRNPALARRALELAISGEPTPTDAPAIIRAVSGVFPDMAYDFAIARRPKVEQFLDANARVLFFTRLASGSRDPAMLAKLDAFARTIPASTRGEVAKAQAAIRQRREVIDRRLPELDRWLAGQAG